MMRPLTAVRVYYIRPSLYPAKFSGYPAKLPSPGRGRQGRRPSFPSTRPNFAGGRSRLDFLLLLVLCQDKKRRRTRVLPLFPVSRQEKNRGFAPLPPPSFLPLMEEKKAKEDQGVRDAGQTSLPRQGTSGTPAKFSGYVRVLDNFFFHNAQRQLRIDGAQ